jgi:hypothetical protein
MSTTETIIWQGRLVSPYNHPRRNEARIRVANEARQVLVHSLAGRPGTARVEYNNLNENTSDHGWEYLWNGEEEVTFSGEHGDNVAFNWVDTVTAHIKAQFTVSSI